MKINLDTTMFTLEDNNVLIRTEYGSDDILIPLEDIEAFKRQIDYAIRLNTDL
jgi:hypothetical protein